MNFNGKSGAQRRRVGRQGKELSRSELLARSRQQRADRDGERLRLRAAKIIQSWWRGVHTRAQLQKQAGLEWKQMLRDTTHNRMQKAPVPLLVRFFDCFLRMGSVGVVTATSAVTTGARTHGIDLTQAWTATRRILIASLKSTTESTNYLSGLMQSSTASQQQQHNSNNMDTKEDGGNTLTSAQAWIHHMQYQKITTLLCERLAAAQSLSSEEVICLWLLLKDPAKLGFGDTAGQSAARRIQQGTLDIGLYLSAIKTQLQLASARTLPKSKANSQVLAVLATLAVLPFRFDKPSTLTTTTTTTTAVSTDPVASVFAEKILSIPTLQARFTQHGIEKLFRLFSAEPVMSRLLKALSQWTAGRTAAEGKNTTAQTAKTAAYDMYLVGNVMQLFNHNAALAQNVATQANLILCLSRLRDRFPRRRSTASSPDTALVEQMKLFSDRKLLGYLYNTVVSVVDDKTNAEDADRTAAEELLYAVCNVIGFVLDSGGQKWLKDIGLDVLSYFAFSTDFKNVLWKALRKMAIWKEQDRVTEAKTLPSRTALNVQTLAQSTHQFQLFCNMFSLFCTVYSHNLMVLDDEDFKAGKTFSMEHNQELVLILKGVLYYCFWHHPSVTSGTVQSPVLPFSDGFANDALTLFQHMRSRQSRAQFCPPDYWVMHKLPGSTLFQEFQASTFRSTQFVEKLAMVLPFDDRVRIFEYQTNTDKKLRARGDLGPPIAFGHGRGVQIKVRRGNILQDGFDQLDQLGYKLKGRVQVQFVDAHGITEAGVDGGGLFKEFLTQLIHVSFDEKYGLFKQTEDNLLYPNPTSASDEEYLGFFSFLGRMVGKALYDNIQIEPQFALFFLRKLVQEYVGVNDLISFDAALYKNLMFMRSYDGNFEDLCVNFCVSDEKFGKTTVVDLIPNGRNIPVTKENVTKFVYMMADYKLNRQIHRPSVAFIQGMHDVLDPSWLTLFTPDELQLLISGSVNIDFKDLKQNCNYSGGYSANHEVVRWFWEIAEEFDEANQADLLRFVTSCPRAPLQGFGSMDPKFCIQRMDAHGNNQNFLPTSATCMNLLRLPRYNSKQLLKEKLLYAIQSNAGFGLS